MVSRVWDHCFPSSSRISTNGSVVVDLTQTRQSIPILRPLSIPSLSRVLDVRVKVVQSEVYSPTQVSHRRAASECGWGGADGYCDWRSGQGPMTRDRLVGLRNPCWGLWLVREGRVFLVVGHSRCLEMGCTQGRWILQPLEVVLVVELHWGARAQAFKR